MFFVLSRVWAKEKILSMVKKWRKMFFSSRRLRIFSFSQALGKTKNIFLYFFNELNTYHLSYFSLLNCLQCMLSISYYVISWS